MPKLGMEPIRRAQIRKAAVKLISKRGFEGTTLWDVAIAARISTGTISHYYDSKLEMLIDAADMLRDHLERGQLDISALRVVVLDEADEFTVVNRPVMGERGRHRAGRRLVRADIFAEADNLVTFGDELLGIDGEARPVAIKGFEQPLNDRGRTSPGAAVIGKARGFRPFDLRIEQSQNRQRS